jgi:hypothetical protein
MGQTFVATTAEGTRTAALGVQAPCRFVVLPDFFADDLVLDARVLPGARAELPGEHFLLHLLEEGDAIVMPVWDKPTEAVHANLTGHEEGRSIHRTCIPYAEGTIWVALLEARGIWHRHDITAADAGRILRLDWRRPFPAQWRVDFTRPDDLTDSWEMLTPRPDGGYIRHGWFGSPVTLPDNRLRWTTVLGRFPYPCWFEGSGAASLQPLAKRARFQGPALIYPVNRIRTTPLGAFTVVDIVRATLGVGPCEYILDVEGQGTSYRGMATCATRDTLNAIYARGDQKRQRTKIEKTLADVLIFIRHIRGRIEEYLAFGRSMREYLAGAGASHPDRAPALQELEKIVRSLDDRFAKRKEAVKTPAYAARLVETFRTRLLDYEGEDALKRCKEITSSLVRIGGNQDELVGECRMVVKVLRQRAGRALAADPRLAPIVREIRRRTQAVLRNPTSYEAPRH